MSRVLSPSKPMALVDVSPSVTVLLNTLLDHHTVYTDHSTPCVLESYLDI